MSPPKFKPDAPVPTTVLAQKWWQEVLGLISTNPEMAAEAVGEMMRKVVKADDAIAEAVGGEPNYADILNGRSASGRGPAVPGVEHKTSDRPHTNNGTGPNLNGAAQTELTRNQLSRIRELHVLEALTGGSGPFTLGDLIRIVRNAGFDASESAVRSQLHRLKEVGYAEQPGGGFYKLTAAGFEYLGRQRVAIGDLREKFVACR